MNIESNQSNPLDDINVRSSRINPYADEKLIELEEGIEQPVSAKNALNEMENAKGPESRTSAAKNFLKIALMPYKMATQAVRYGSLGLFCALATPPALVGAAMGAFVSPNAKKGFDLGFQAFSYLTAPILAPLLLVNSLAALAGKAIEATYSDKVVWSGKGDVKIWLQLTIAKELHKMHEISSVYYGIDLKTPAYKLQQKVLEDFAEKHLHDGLDMTFEEFKGIATERNIRGREGLSSKVESDKPLFDAFVNAKSNALASRMQGKIVPFTVDDLKNEISKLKVYSDMNKEFDEVTNLTLVKLKGNNLNDFIYEQLNNNIFSNEEIRKVMIKQFPLVITDEELKQAKIDTFEAGILRMLDKYDKKEISQNLKDVKEELNQERQNILNSVPESLKSEYSEILKTAAMAALAKKGISPELFQKMAESYIREKNL